MQSNGRFTIAIHLCIYLQFKGEELVSSQQIAKSVDTNPVVIRRLVGRLREKNIIGSVSGAKGGFYLTRPAKDITLWDIYQAVKDQSFFYKPQSNPECPVGSNLSHLVDQIYSEAELSMESVLGKVSVDQLNNKLDTILELDEDKFC